MARQQTCEVKEAYNRIAERYDSLMAVSGLYRERLWKLYRGTFQAGQHILDLGCGTGTDSIFLARMGCRVTALDISPNMLDQLRNKISQDEFGQLTTIIEADLNDLSGRMLPVVDGVVSGFAAVNTVADLKSLANTLHTLLSKDGRVIIHGLNQTGSIQKSSVSFENKPEITTRMVRIGDVEVPHFLMTPAVLYQNYFSDGFELTNVSGIGHYYTFYEHPRYPVWMKKGLIRIENLVFSKATLIRKGRFFIMEMKKGDAKTNKA